MRKLILLLAAAVAFSMTAFAQESGTQATTGTESTTTTTTKTTKHSKHAKSEEAGESKAQEAAEAKAGGEAKESQMTGCLAKDASGNGFLLTNAKHKKGVEVKSSEDLSAHVGHEVRLMGTWEKPTADAAGGGAGPKGHQMRTFNVTNVKHLADTCKASAAAGKKSKTEKAETSKTPGL